MTYPEVIAPGQPFQDLERSLPCVYCHAEPGEECRTATGGPAAFMHAARWYTAKTLIEVREREAAAEVARG